MSSSSTTATLEDAFAPYGPMNVRIVYGRGFGSVDVEASRMGEAIHGMHGSVLDGRVISVDEGGPPRSSPLGRWKDDGGHETRR